MSDTEYEISSLRQRLNDLEEKVGAIQGDIRTLVEDIQNLYSIKEDKKGTNQEFGRAP